MQQYRARGLAVVGLEETLEALANGQVDELLVSGALEETHPLPEEVRTHSGAASFPIQGEERPAKNRGKRPCPIYW